ncbi:MAG: MogA/MoaB family molybdenum cofactor biosynthesis protein [Acidobacteria bacterium]|nr:MogA/MoaB family molybdenum cofactor biosynthesis protein [Acidobacteriota bacterium]
MNEMTAAVLTVSDSAAQGTRTDASGPAVAQALERKGFSVVATKIVADEHSAIEAALLELCETTRLVVTTGGTGLAPRDVTPEATRAVCDRLIEGLAERMRSEGLRSTPFAALSRGVCGIRGRSLIVNLPGSPKGAAESLAAVIELLPHALEVLGGKMSHGE